MKSKKEIYQNIKNNIKANISDSWDKAILKINVAVKFSSYKGYYYHNGIEKPIKVSKFDLSIDNDLIDLHTITTINEKEVERWNVAFFTLFKDDTYKIDFVWDQELYDSVYKGNENSGEKNV